ncbi:MAG: hypothetical protein EKK54_06260 [Neisseriaceae bacterium]|nr:MAG: hypothetical protein EKK54_06260 [Neisseriaceae bacterium]
MIDDKQVKRALERLEQNHIDTSVIDTDKFTNDQIMVLCRGLERHQDISNITNPDISDNEMEQILDDEFDIGSNLMFSHGINPQNYKIGQLYELNEALNKGYDITPYKSPEFSAAHMFLARTYQENNLPLDGITPQATLPSIIERRNELINEANERKMETDIAAYNPKYEQQFDKLLEVTGELNYICKNSLNVNSEIGYCLDQYRNDLLATGLSPEFVNSLEELALSPANQQSNIFYPPFEHITPDTTPERLNVIREIFQYEYTANGPFLPRNYTNEQLTVLEKAHNNLPSRIFQLDPSLASPKTFELFLNEKHNLDNLTGEFVLINREFGMPYSENEVYPVVSYIEFNSTEELLEVLKYFENPDNSLCEKMQNDRYLSLSTGENLHISQSPSEIGPALLREIATNEHFASEYHEIMPISQISQSQTYNKQLEYRDFVSTKIQKEINVLIDNSSAETNKVALINWDNGKVKTFQSEKEALSIKSHHEDLVKVEPRALEKYATQKFQEKGKEFQKTQSPKIEEGLSLF